MRNTKLDRTTRIETTTSTGLVLEKWKENSISGSMKMVKRSSRWRYLSLATTRISRWGL